MLPVFSWWLLHALIWAFSSSMSFMLISLRSLQSGGAWMILASIAVFSAVRLLSRSLIPICSLVALTWAGSWRLIFFPEPMVPLQILAGSGMAPLPLPPWPRQPCLLFYRIPHGQRLYHDSCHVESSDSLLGKYYFLCRSLLGRRWDYCYKTFVTRGWNPSDTISWVLSNHNLCEIAWFHALSCFLGFPKLNWLGKFSRTWIDSSKSLAN